MNRIHSNDIYKYGREIIQLVSNSDIPYTDYKKCQEFNLSFTFPSWSHATNKIRNNEPENYSHIDLSWSAKPRKNSSIIWTNIKRIKTSELESLINSIKRDKKIDLVIK